jgi:uncharacterized OB-fold protein
MWSRPLQPSLYRLSEDGRTLDLLFEQCSHCQELTFPAAGYGCASCGAGATRPLARPGKGRLIAAVTVHAAIVPGLQPPQLIGEVELVPGLIQEVLLEGAEARLTPGTLVVARPGQAPDAEVGVFLCRFGPEVA